MYREAITEARMLRNNFDTCNKHVELLEIERQAYLKRQELRMAELMSTGTGVVSIDNVIILMILMILYHATHSLRIPCILIILMILIVSHLDCVLYRDDHRTPDLSQLQQPRIFSNHLPFPLLAESIRSSSCKVVYICPNPFDNLVSSLHFYSKSRILIPEPLSIDEAFDLYCRGVVEYGPFWDHVTGFWKESMKNSHKVLFMKYEEMMEDPLSQIKRLESFLGFPFSLEEERLEVNKHGKIMWNIEYKSFFRKGEVVDRISNLTPSMVERLNNIMEEKSADSGLAFKNTLQSP